LVRCQFYRHRAFPCRHEWCFALQQFLNNTFLLTQIPDTNFHDTSFDSFLRFLNPFLGIQIAQTRLMALGAKVLLLVASLA